MWGINFLETVYVGQTEYLPISVWGKQIELRVTLDIYHVKKYGDKSDSSQFH